MNTFVPQFMVRLHEKRNCVARHRLESIPSLSRHVVQQGFRCSWKHLFTEKIESGAQSFSPNSARDGRRVCRPSMNFSVTKMQENSIARF
jgi:hypothetical protein